MAWVKKGSLRGPQGIGVVDLLANRLWSGAATMGTKLTVNYVNTKTMLAATLSGCDAPLVGWLSGGKAYLHGTGTSGGALCELYCLLTIATNSATVTLTRVVPVQASDGYDYGGGKAMAAPAVTAIYGI